MGSFIFLASVLFLVTIIDRRDRRINMMRESRALRQRNHNPQVVGSTPTPATNFNGENENE